MFLLLFLNFLLFVHSRSSREDEFQANRHDRSQRITQSPTPAPTPAPTAAPTGGVGQFVLQPGQATKVPMTPPQARTTAVPTRSNPPLQSIWDNQNAPPGSTSSPTKVTKQTPENQQPTRPRPINQPITSSPSAPPTQIVRPLGGDIPPDHQQPPPFSEDGPPTPRSGQPSIPPLRTPRPSNQPTPSTPTRQGQQLQNPQTSPTGAPTQVQTPSQSPLAPDDRQNGAIPARLTQAPPTVVEEIKNPPPISKGGGYTDQNPDHGQPPPASDDGQPPTTPRNGNMIPQTLPTSNQPTFQTGTNANLLPPEKDGFVPKLDDSPTFTPTAAQTRTSPSSPRSTNAPISSNRIPASTKYDTFY